MSNSREDSPDWLRAFQAPSSILTLSSDSEASLKTSPLRDDTADVKRDSTLDESQLVESDEDQEEKVSSKLSPKSASKSVNKKTPRKRQKVEATPAKRKKIMDSGTPAKRKKIMDSDKKTGKEDTTKSEESSKKQTEIHEPKAIWALSSDSESDAIFQNGTDTDQPCESELEEKEMQNVADLLDNKESVPKIALKGTSPKKKKIADNTSTAKKLKDEMKTEGDVVHVPEVEKTSEKHVESSVSSNMLPLVLPEKVQRSKALVECEGDSIDLSGDIGAVGRVIISGNSPVDREMLLDLKGTIYRTTIVPSRTFCVVSVGPSEAKIEAIINDFIQLKPQSNVYDAETMVEGTLDGFSFDSEDEAEKMPKGDQNEGDKDPANDKTIKTKAKSVKKSAVVQKKVKATGGGKQVKKRKPQAAKKGKAKK